jgi:alpha-amylase
MCADNDYSFGSNFEKLLAAAGLSNSDIQKIKIWSSDFPKEYPVCGNKVIPDTKEVI